MSGRSEKQDVWATGPDGQCPQRNAGADAAYAESKNGALEGLIDSIEESGDDMISVKDVLDTFAHRSVGAVISVFALLAALPLVGGIPGMSIGTATLILLIVTQSLSHRRRGIWVPRFFARRKMSKQAFRRAAEKARPWLQEIDRWMHPRLKRLTVGPIQRLVMIVAIVIMTLTFYPLALLPWGVTVPSLGVLALGLSMMSGDGYLALFGYAMLLGTALTGFLIVGGV